MRLQRQRRGALTLVFAFLLAQLAGFVHLAFEQHAVCAEHGELLHVADSGALPAQETSEHPVGPVANGDAEGSEHGHCGVLPAVQQKHKPAAGPLAHSFAPAALVLYAPSSSEVAHAAVPLLLLAPKQSPPA